MSDMYRLHSYGIVKMTRAQRQALLAAVDSDGRLPDTVVSPRVLQSIPQEWARTDTRTGSRILTPTGRAALLPLDRYRQLRGAHPETGAVYGLNHRDRQGLHRDQLIILQNDDGQTATPTDHWMINALPYITERGRKLVGIPLTAPSFTTHLPVGAHALWTPEGEPPTPVEIKGWPFTDGTVRVCLLASPTLTYSEKEVPAGELRPA
ncbi:hypothetical protein [Streptomyces flaveolus]|uniref:hypothetical protein n=1 Tax=Streptomyces flaveolus TaxID=67297 RepID=UPI00370033C3